MVASDVNKNFDKEIPASRKNQYQGKKNNTKETPRKKQHHGSTNKRLPTQERYRQTVLPVY
jgi:hypothetical protein